MYSLDNKTITLFVLKLAFFSTILRKEEREKQKEND